MSRAVDLSPDQLQRLIDRAGPESPLRAIAPRKRGARRRDLEHQEQVKLFEWAVENEARRPALKLLFAIPNFAGRLGKKTAIHGARLKAEGRKAGVPDVMLPVARGRWNGLFVELKSDTGTVTKEQEQWLADLRKENYCTAVARGFEAARDLIIEYLK